MSAHKILLIEPNKEPSVIFFDEYTESLSAILGSEGLAESIPFCTKDIGGSTFTYEILANEFYLSNDLPFNRVVRLPDGKEITINGTFVLVTTDYKTSEDIRSLTTDEVVDFTSLFALEV